MSCKNMPRLHQLHNLRDELTMTYYRVITSYSNLFGWQWHAQICCGGILSIEWLEFLLGLSDPFWPFLTLCSARAISLRHA